MISLPQFCARFGIAEDAARQALARPAGEEERVWYVQLVLAIGAWITAIIGLAFVAFLMFDLLEIEEPGIGVSAIGVALFALALAPLRRQHTGAFLAQLAVAGALCGAALGVLGIGFWAESWPVAILVSLPFAGAAIWTGRPWLLQFLLSGLVIGLAMLWIWDENALLVVGLISPTLPVGVFLALRPPRLDLRPTTVALILALPIAVVLESVDRLSASIAQPGWMARVVCFATLAFLVAVNFRSDNIAPRARPALVAIAAAALLATIMLSPGIAAALVIMLLGYTLGSRALAVVGTTGFVYFLWVYYLELERTLLVKSVILMVAGATLLAVGYLASRAARVEAKP